MMMMIGVQGDLRDQRIFGCTYLDIHFLRAGNNLGIRQH
jgi:hypothetical protein